VGEGYILGELNTILSKDAHKKKTPKNKKKKKNNPHRKKTKPNKKKSPTPPPPHKTPPTPNKKNPTQTPLWFDFGLNYLKEGEARTGRKRGRGRPPDPDWREDGEHGRSEGRSKMEQSRRSCGKGEEEDLVDPLPGKGSTGGLKAKE